MARNGTGTYTLPQPPFVPNTTISSTAVNSDLSDIAAALTQSISKDGQTTYTGNQPMGNNKLTGLAAGTALTDSVNMSQIAAGTATYGGVAGGTADAITLTPSPGITAYAIGQKFDFKAASTNTGAMTANVSSVGVGDIKWPNGSALIAGDVVTGGMYVLEVQATTPVFHLQTVSASPVLKSGSTMTGTLAMSGAAINEAKGADIASATTTDIGAATGNFVHITGTTTITGLGTIQAGTRRAVVFDGALILTHNATSLILPGAANITTAAGDSAVFESEGSGNWRCIQYQRTAYAPAGGQTVSLITGAVATGSTVFPIDDTIPQNTEGDQYMSLAITPKSATSKLNIQVVVNCGGDGTTMAAAIFQDSTAGALAAGYVSPTAVNATDQIVINYSMVSGTTSATTFKVRAGLGTGLPMTFNGSSGNRFFGGVLASSITITESLT